MVPEVMSCLWHFEPERIKGLLLCLSINTSVVTDRRLEGELQN